MSLPQAALQYLDAHWPEHLALTQTFLRQPSVSAQNWGVVECAELLRGWLVQRGAAVSLHGRASHPIVFAEWKAARPDAPTLLIYGMYDVQPVDNQDWTTPPFAAEIWKHPLGGESIVARGACNSKGPLMAMLHVIEAFQATDGLPVHIKWTIEGEEEIGSLALEGFYRDHRDRLRGDAAFEPFWSQGQPEDPPNIILGTKGVVGLEFIARSGAWGGSRDVIHSSLGVWVASPAWRLIQALDTLVDAQQRLTVDGVPLYGEMLDSDEGLLRSMAERIDPVEEARRLGVQRFKDDAGPYELARRLSFAPMLNLNGIKAGYLGEGSHTILPNEARATADFRMPPGFDMTDVLAKLRAHLDARGFDDIEILTDSGYPAARTSVDAPVVQAMLAAYRALGIEPVVEPIEPSATPYYLYTDVLGVPFVWGGLGWAGGSHGPDEWCSVQGLRDLMRSTAAFLQAFAEQAPQPSSHHVAR